MTTKIIKVKMSNKRNAVEMGADVEDTEDRKKQSSKRTDYLQLVHTLKHSSTLLRSLCGDGRTSPKYTSSCCAPSARHSPGGRSLSSAAHARAAT